MKKLLGSLLVSFGLVFSLSGQASPAAPQAGVDYSVLQPAQPADVPQGKIQVTEFFWYGCPHCAAFEPTIEAWVKKQGKDVVFNRVPVAFRKDFEPHQRLYFALVALGKEADMTPKVFHAIQVEKNYLLTPEAQADFLAKSGIDKKAFLNAYNSFSVQSDVKRASQMAEAYKIDGVPTLAIQGKYIASPSLTAESMTKSGNKPRSEADIFNNTLTTVDAIIGRIRAKKF